MFVDIMRRKIFILSVTIYLFLFSCIQFKEHPLDPTTPRGYFLNSFLRNNSIDQDNNSIDQEAKGILDDSFGSPNGYKIQPIGSSNDDGQSLAIQSDGKILLGGSCSNGSNNDFCIARFNSDGTLDTTFGSSGKVIQPIGSSDDIGRSLAIQPNGKILFGGYCQGVSNNDFCIARFNSNGTLDTSFGTSGKVIQHIGSYYDYCYGQSLAIQSDGKILLGGNCSNGINLDFCIARFK
jgi:uncharacterized delta-60 repeat protein